MNEETMMGEQDEPGEPWLVVIDPQRIFADPSSQWCAPRFAEIVAVIDRLVAGFGDRVIVTRWVAGQPHEGSWRDYFTRWPFADLAANDPLLDLVDAARLWARRPTVDCSTFGKWGASMQELTGEHPHLVLTGVATDCCVISTALAAADAGAWVSVVSDAVAGSADAEHEAALHVMELFSPQIEVVEAQDVLTG